MEVHVPSKLRDFCTKLKIHFKSEKIRKEREQTKMKKRRNEKYLKD